MWTSAVSNSAGWNSAVSNSTVSNSAVSNSEMSNSAVSNSEMSNSADEISIVIAWVYPVRVRHPGHTLNNCSTGKMFMQLEARHLWAVHGTPGGGILTSYKTRKPPGNFGAPRISLLVASCHPGDVWKIDGRGSVESELLVGWGDNKAVTELSFGHVTSKTWAYSGVFGFFRKKFRQKNSPPPPKSLFQNTMGNPFFYFFKYWPKRSKKKI